MKFEKIDISTYSQIEMQFSVNTENTILVVKYYGKYRNGVEGNIDGLCMLSKLAQYYFFLDPIAIIIDLQELEYSWGNTLLKVINFSGTTDIDIEDTLNINIVITSATNNRAIVELTSVLEKGKVEFCETYDGAIEIANEFIYNKLKP